MKTKLVSSVVIMAFLFLTGCETMQQHKGATTGAAVGAAAGATAGALLGKKGAKTETAIIGGLLGALVGGAIGHYAYDVKQSREETEKQYGYQPSSGVIVRLENASSTPSSIKQGEKVDLNATYALLLPTSGSTANITETREIRYQGELVGKPEVNVERSGGTYNSTVPMYLPSDAKRGTYVVLTTIQTASAKDSRESSFIVR